MNNIIHAKSAADYNEQLGTLRHDTAQALTGGTRHFQKKYDCLPKAVFRRAISNRFRAPVNAAAE